MEKTILNTHNKEEYAPAHTAEYLQSMTYKEYLKQQLQATGMTMVPMLPPDCSNIARY